MPESDWVDFKAVKAAVTMEMVLAHYGIDWLKEKGESLVGRCPIHRGARNSNAFHVSRSKGVWKCFGDCRAGGNVLDFVMRMEDVELRQAALLLVEWFHVELPDRPRSGPSPPREARSPSPAPRKAARSVHDGPKQRGRGARGSKAPSTAADAATTILEANSTPPGKDREVTPPPHATTGRAPPIFPDTTAVNPPLTFHLKGLDPTHPYLRQRVDEATIQHFGLGYCAKGLMVGRIAIPIHDAQGRLIAYAGRAVDDQLAEADGKYKLPPHFKKSHVLWNLHRAAAHAAQDGLVVVEGFFGAIRLHQAGIPNAVALMGSSLSPEQEELLLLAVGRTQGKVSLMLDRDDAGRTATKELLARLITKTHVRVVPYDGRQPDDLSPAQLRALFLGA